MTNRTCDQCGAEFAPTHARNRYCEVHRGRRASKLREYHDVTCVQCGVDFRSARSTGKLCSDGCRADWYRDQGFGAKQTVCHLPADHPVRRRIRSARETRGPIRIALDTGDRAGVIAAVRTYVQETPGGCWIWQRRLRDGYPEVRVGGKYHAVHRLVLEAKHGARLGKQAAHHICATPSCVAPHHLQPVTARENVAEMLARTYMESRIADLEAALAKLEPAHPLLTEIGVAVA